MTPTSILATIRAALEAVPIIAKEISNLRQDIVNVRNAQVEREKQKILEQLNVLTTRITHAEDKEAMAKIVADLNSL